jgi:methanogenic corrinoid protein MtbC1
MSNATEPGRTGTLPDEVSRLESALLSMDRPMVWDILGANSERPDSMERMERLIGPALERIGQSWEAGSVALSQVYMSGRICEEALSACLDAERCQPRIHPPMAIAALEDSHALGKRMVRSMLLAAGYTVRDYGHGISAEALADRAIREHIDILLISTLMLRSAMQIKRVASIVRKARPQIKILAGGAPFLFDLELWREVGADATGRNASDAAAIVGQWCGHA